MSKEIIRQLKSLKHTETGPSEAWLKKNRELLLSQISNTVTPKEHIKLNSENLWQAMSIFMPQSVVYKIVRPVTAVILIAVMGVGSWVATVSASYEALPGEWLYPAKRAAEKIQVTGADVVGDKNNVAKLHSEFALKRAEEVKKIISQGNPDNIEVAAKTVNDLKEEINNVNSKLEEIKTNVNSKVDAVKNINQNAQEIKDVLKEVKVNLLVNTDDAQTSDLSSQVSEVKNLVKDTAVKAVEVMVEKHLQGDASISKDDVKNAINVQLQSAIKDAAESKQSLVEVNKAIDVVKTEVTAIAQVSKDAASSTHVLSEKVEATSKQTQAAVNTSQQFNTETGKTVTEAQQLLSQDNLAQAVSKVKEANAVTAQAEKMIDDTLKAVQNILPVVAVASEGAAFTSSSMVFASSSVVIVTTTTPSTSTVGTIITVSTTIKLMSSTTSAVIPKTTTTLKSQ